MPNAIRTRRRTTGARPWSSVFTIQTLESRTMLTRFAVIGDFSSDITISPTRDVAAMVQSWNPEFVATTGDNNYPAGAASTIDANIGQWYHSFISPYTGSYGGGSPDGKNRFWPAIGNHDWNSSAGYSPYTNYFTLPGNERYYTVTQGNVQLFIVNSDTHEPSGTSATSTQGTWLKNQLAASTTKWKVVIFHHPAYTSGSEGNNTYMQWPLQTWGASAVISGHDHVYERIDKNGLPYFINGLGGESIASFSTTASGSKVRYNSDYGAMLIDGGSTSMNFKFINRKGAIIDDFTLGTAAPRAALIAPGTTWKYLDNGTNQGSAWRALSFDDTAWKSGHSQLGYGDGDEATVVGYGANSSNKFITTYFRKTLNVADPAGLSDVKLRLIVDDGAIVYVNGVEAVRTNLPTGTVANTTLATTSLGDPAESTWNTYSLSSSLFRTGSNVVAVEVHQAAASSSDMSFNLDLSALQSSQPATTPPAAPTNAIARAVSASQIDLTWSDNSSNESGFQIQRSTDNITFTALATTLSGATFYSDRNLAASKRYYYRIAAINSAGVSSFISVDATTFSQSTLIPAGSTWKYLDNGTNQGTAWRAVSFVDTAWKSGAAELGYGDGDEATVVGYGSSATNKFITTYFRRTFNVADPSTIDALNMRLRRDDGAIVYLNGTEVYRTNMPTGTVGYTTLASASIEDTSWFTAALNRSLLVTGNNVIAVEVHQGGASSSDISFNFELTATSSTSLATAASTSTSTTSLASRALTTATITKKPKHSVAREVFA